MSIKKNVEQKQLGVLVPLIWIPKLKKKADMESARRGIRVTYIDLIREATASVYGLKPFVNGQVIRRVKDSENE